MVLKSEAEGKSYLSLKNFTTIQIILQQGMTNTKILSITKWTNYTYNN